MGARLHVMLAISLLIAGTDLGRNVLLMWFDRPGSHFKRLYVIDWGDWNVRRMRKSAVV